MEHMQGDTACHWDCVQRSYQWHGKRGLIILLCLQQARPLCCLDLKSQAPELARLEQKFLHTTSVHLMAVSDVQSCQLQFMWQFRANMSVCAVVCNMSVCAVMCNMSACEVM